MIDNDYVVFVFVFMVLIALYVRFVASLISSHR